MARRKNIERLVNRLGAKSLVFVGMMGCGKSAIGKAVAAKLDRNFYDSDAEIVEAAGMSIPEIFENFGENEFRRVENRVIERLLKEEPAVIALGGGAFMSAKTRKAVKRRAISIWLKADIDLLVKRVSRRPGKRPLLATGDPKAILEKLSAERNPVYEQTEVQVQTSGGTKTQTRDAVLDALNLYFEDPKKKQEAAE